MGFAESINSHNRNFIFSLLTSKYRALTLENS